MDIFDKILSASETPEPENNPDIIKNIEKAVKLPEDVEKAANRSYCSKLEDWWYNLIA